jgi:hypothetical protein
MGLNITFGKKVFECWEGASRYDTHPPVVHLYRVLNDGTTVVSLGEWEFAQSGRYISSPATMQLLRTRIRIACHYKRETSHYVTPNVCYFLLHNCVQRSVKFITRGTARAWPLAVVFSVTATCFVVYWGKLYYYYYYTLLFPRFRDFVPSTSFTLLFSCYIVSILSV